MKVLKSYSEAVHRDVSHLRTDYCFSVSVFFSQQISFLFPPGTEYSFSNHHKLNTEDGQYDPNYFSVTLQVQGFPNNQN